MAAEPADRVVFRPVIVGETLPPMPLDLVLRRERPDGTWLPVGELAPSASAGTLLALDASDPQLLPLRYVPEPGWKGRVTLAAGGATLTLDLDPAVAGRVVVEVSPGSLVKEPGAEARVRVRVLDSQGTPLTGDTPPRLVVNVGTLSEPVREGPGTWAAVYRPGPARYPEVAVIAAIQPWPHTASPGFAAGHAVLPLAAAIDLPGETRPRVQTTVEIAGEAFGPVRSDRRGRFLVPVVVPPGHGTGRGRSLDRFGNKRVTEIDLRLPPTQRVSAVMQPTRLVADGASRAQVAVFLVDPFGKPSPGERPVLTAARGSVSALAEEGQGVYRAWYVAPAGAGEGRDRLMVTVPGDPRSRAELEVTLVPGPPAGVTAGIDPEVVTVPASGPARITVDVRDRFGAPVPSARLESRAARGRVSPDEATSPAIGTAIVDYSPPTTPDGWEDDVSITVWSPLGQEAARVAFDAGCDVPRGCLVALDAWERPVPGAVLRLDGEPTRADQTGRVPVPAQAAGAAAPRNLRVHVEGVRAAQDVSWGMDPEGRLHGAPAWSGVITASLAVPLMEPLPADVRVEVMRDLGTVKVRWRILGVSGIDREVSLAVGTGEVLDLKGVEGVQEIDAAPGTPVVVTDVETGVSAVGRVPSPDGG